MRRRKEEEDGELWEDEYRSGPDDDADYDAMDDEEGIYGKESGYGGYAEYPGRYDDRDGREYDGGYDGRYGDRTGRNRQRRYDRDERSYGGDDRIRRKKKDRYYYDEKRGWVKEKEGRGYERDKNSGRRRKKHSVLPIVLLVIILVIGLPTLWLFSKVRGMQTGGMSGTGVEESISEEARDSTSGYLNIAVLGVDSINGSLDEGNNRSDVMIIASINERTGEIRLMSLYRDTYLDAGDGNYQKANAAYAFGGPTQTVEMMNRNLDLNIEDYAVVGFEGIAKIVDAVGGVEIDVQEDEIEHLNNYQLTMSQETGMENIPVTSPGLQTLNGLQATAYCRIRYTAGDDFRRTQRQREVLTKVFEKIKSNPIHALASVNALMGYVRTSMSSAEIFSLGIQAFRFSIAESTGFPNENMRTVGYIGEQSCVIPVTLSSNVTWLHSELFGDTDYTPSKTVQDISAHISSVSGY